MTTLSEKELNRIKTRASRGRRCAEFYRKMAAIVRDYNENGKFSADTCEIVRGLIFSGICSKHNGKMEGQQSFSTSCKCNEYCKLRALNGECICADCYAETQLNMYKDQAIKNMFNSILMNKYIYPAAAMPFINAAIFRLESFGDLASETQLINYFTLCRRNSRTLFTIWTKNWFLVDRVIKSGYAKPKNLIIICSSPFQNKAAADLLNKYNWIDKIFTVYSLDHLLNQGMSLKDINSFINCGGRKCIECQRCYSRNRTIFVNEMLKKDQAKFNKMLKAAGLK